MTVGGASDMMLIAVRDLRSADGVDTIKVDGYGGSATIGSTRGGCGRGTGRSDSLGQSHTLKAK